MTKSKLREIIREEIQKLNEAKDYKIKKKGSHLFLTAKDGSYKRMGYLVNEGKKVVKAKTVKRTRHQNQRQVAQELIKKLKRKGWKVPQYLSDTSTLEKQIINAYEKARKKWDSTMGDTVILSVSDNKDFTDKNFKWVKESASESINEANFRQGDKFELGKDLDYGDEKLHAGDYEVVKARGPHQYQLKDTHSGKQFTLHKKDFEKYAKKKQFKQINEAGMFDDYYELNPAYLSKFIKSYKKLNSKNVVKKKGDYTYGFRKGEREAHWKFDNDDYKLQYDIAKVKALGLINNFNRFKKDHPWG